MKMNLISAAVGLLVLSLSACVSTGKYKKLETAQSALQTQADDLTAQNEKLLEEVKKMEAEKEALKAEAANKEASYNALVGELSNELSQGQLQVKKYKDMLTVDVAEKIFFDSGKAQLKKDGEAVLLKVGEALAKFNDKTIRVVGHTDNVPVSAKTGFASNWELSVMRATTVVRFLQEKGKLPPERMIAAGQGEYMPVAPNDTPEGRQKNRRIEIMLLDKAMTDVIVQPQAPN
ncbi:MAG: flagellar motor protein MotB [Elusimicrobia bacterium]|nr:flagellar motor protein MotB [Elusimicrobiota bacterium]